MADDAAAIEQFGVHLIIDGYDADPLWLADLCLLEALLRELPDNIGIHRSSEAWRTSTRWGQIENQAALMQNFDKC